MSEEVKKAGETPAKTSKASEAKEGSVIVISYPAKHSGKKYFTNGTEKTVGNHAEISIDSANQLISKGIAKIK